MGACDFTTNQNVVIIPGGNHNSNATYSQLYILVDQDGTIVATSTTGDFGPQDFGFYEAYAFNYEIADAPTILPNIGIDITQINDGCSVFSAPLPITVCNISSLEVCEDSGNDIIIFFFSSFI